MASIPASHRDDKLPLPMPPAVVTRTAGVKEVAEDSLAFLKAWCSDETDSNLAVVFGGYGSAKTPIMRQLAADLDRGGFEIHQIDFHSLPVEIAAARTTLSQQVLSGTDEKPHIVLIDNFDALSLLDGTQRVAPDCRHLEDLLATNYRVVAFTRRPPSDHGDELFRQIDSPNPQLTIRSPVVVSLQPWTLTQITEAFTQASDQRLHKALDFLKIQPERNAAQLRRPLFLKMLVRIADDLATRSGAITPNDLLRIFTGDVLSADFSCERSRLSSVHKETILTELAFDICDGGPSRAEPNSNKPPRALPEDWISTRVLELIKGRESDLRLEYPGKQFSEYDWTHDFVHTCHLLAPLPQPEGTTERYYEFISSTFYEYFLAQAILRRIAKDKALGLPEEGLKRPTFDSMALYFVRAGFSDSIVRAIHHLVERSQLAWPDRLLFLYLLEDEDGLSKLLADLPEEYLDAISAMRADPECDFFLHKVILYQLVLLGREPATEYIAMVRADEDPDQLLAEADLQSDAGDTTSYLLRRLDNGELSNARAITAFRLGQLGDERAITRLVQIAKDPELDEIVRREAKAAVKEIRRRYRLGGEEEWHS